MSKIFPVSDGATQDVLDDWQVVRDGLPIDLLAKHEAHYSTCLSFFSRLGLLAAEPQTLPRIVAFATFLWRLNLDSVGSPSRIHHLEPGRLTTRLKSSFARR